METISTLDLQKALVCASKQIIEAEPYLTQIDTIIGDGDHGIGMKTGFSALEKQLEDNMYQTPHELLHESGLCLVRNMGGASGVLFGTIFIAGLDAIEQKNELNSNDLMIFFDQGAQDVQKRGRTKPGDKTMVDALVPAVDKMRETIEETRSIEDTLYAAYQGALEGVEESKEMLPRAGRAKNFRDDAIGVPDPGAISVSILFKGLYESTARSE